MLQVSVLEKSWVLESVTYSTVEGNVAEPNERHRNSARMCAKVSKSQQGERSETCMAKVIQGGPGTRIRQIAKHEDVGDEEQQSEQQPAEVKMLIEGN